MTTPTDPYSRPGDDDKHDDILGPLGNDSSEEQPRDDSWRTHDEDETVPSFLNRDQFNDNDEEPIDSTQAWKPNFDEVEDNESNRDQDHHDADTPVFDDGHHTDEAQHHDGELGDHNDDHRDLVDHTDGETVATEDHVRDENTEADSDVAHDSSEDRAGVLGDHDHGDDHAQGRDLNEDRVDDTNHDADETVVAGSSRDTDRDAEVKDDYDSDRWDREFGDDKDGGLRGDIASHRDSSDDHTASDDATVATAATTTAGGAPTRTSVFARPEHADEEKTDVAETSTPHDVATTDDKTTVAPAAAGTTFPKRPVREHTIDVPDEPHGRGWAHVGVFFATLLLAPFAWYLVADAGVRLGVLQDSQWNTGNADWMSILELVGALACLGILWFLAAFSSVGANFFGLILFAAGMAALIVPSTAQDLLGSSAVQSFADFNTFTGNVAHHLTNDLAAGRIAVYGFLLMMTGVVSHHARRKGADRGGILATRRALLSKNPDA